MRLRRSFFCLIGMNLLALFVVPYLYADTSPTRDSAASEESRLTREKNFKEQEKIVSVSKAQEIAIPLAITSSNSDSLCSFPNMR